MDPTNPLLTADEFAEFLNISKASFWRRVADGTIPKPVKLGGLSRWPRSDATTVVDKAKARHHPQPAA